MIKREIEGGATNRKDDHQAVDLTMCGDDAAITALIERIGNGNPLNCWGACASSVLEVENGEIDWTKHKVTTSNVDTFNWHGNVEMFI